MTNEERYKKYMQEHCPNCKNKNTDLCDIRIIVHDDIIYTKCNHYVKDSLKVCMKNNCKRCYNYNKCFESEKRKV